jgi:hypothetical protein
MVEGLGPFVQGSCVTVNSGIHLERFPLKFLASFIRSLWRQQIQQPKAYILTSLIPRLLPWSIFIFVENDGIRGKFLQKLRRDAHLWWHKPQGRGCFCQYLSYKEVRSRSSRVSRFLPTTQLTSQACQHTDLLVFRE